MFDVTVQTKHYSNQSYTKLLFLIKHDLVGLMSNADHEKHEAH